MALVQAVWLFSGFWAARLRTHPCDCCQEPPLGQPFHACMHAKQELLHSVPKPAVVVQVKDCHFLGHWLALTQVLVGKQYHHSVTLSVISLTPVSARFTHAPRKAQ